MALLGADSAAAQVLAPAAELAVAVARVPLALAAEREPAVGRELALAPSLAVVLV